MAEAGARAAGWAQPRPRVGREVETPQVVEGRLSVATPEEIGARRIRVDRPRGILASVRPALDGESRPDRLRQPARAGRSHVRLQRGGACGGCRWCDRRVRLLGTDRAARRAHERERQQRDGEPGHGTRAGAARATGEGRSEVVAGMHRPMLGSRPLRGDDAPIEPAGRRRHPADGAGAYRAGDPTAIGSGRREGRCDVIGEFRDFLFRGNIIDLAVAVVLGAAFGAIVASLVADIITPLLGILGIPDFSTWVDPGRSGTPAELRIGAFLNTLISFVAHRAGDLPARREADAAPRGGARPQPGRGGGRPDRGRAAHRGPRRAPQPPGLSPAASDRSSGPRAAGARLSGSDRLSVPLRGQMSTAEARRPPRSARIRASGRARHLTIAPCSDGTRLTARAAVGARSRAASRPATVPGVVGGSAFSVPGRGAGLLGGCRPRQRPPRARPPPPPRRPAPPRRAAPARGRAARPRRSRRSPARARPGR